MSVDTVAGNDSNEKINLSDEHQPEEEPDQLSEVKSDHKVDSGIKLFSKFYSNFVLEQLVTEE